MTASLFGTPSDAGGSGGGLMTVREYLEDWLELKEPTLSPTTAAWYRYVIRRHVLPELGHLSLNELKPQHIQRTYSRRLKATPDGKRQLSPSSVRCIHRVLHSALSQAVRLQLITRNPCDAVDPPRGSRRGPRYWKPEEAARFLEAIKGNRLFALFHLALGTGLRRGELLGLRWADVDLQRGYLTVNQVRVRAGAKTVSKEPKTSGSRRTIALSKQVCETLKRHAAAQQEEKRVMGEAYTDNGLVFAGIDGSPLNPDYIGSQYFQRLITLAGVPRINFHGLRHTHATLLAMGGVPLKTVSARLGHSSVRITGDIYSHVLDRMDKEAAEKFDAALEAALKANS